MRDGWDTHFSRMLCGAGLYRTSKSSGSRSCQRRRRSYRSSRLWRWIGPRAVLLRWSANMLREISRAIVDRLQASSKNWLENEGRRSRWVGYGRQRVWSSDWLMLRRAILTWSMRLGRRKPVWTILGIMAGEYESGGVKARSYSRINVEEPPGGALARDIHILG